MLDAGFEEEVLAPTKEADHDADPEGLAQNRGHVQCILLQTELPDNDDMAIRHGVNQYSAFTG